MDPLDVAKEVQRILCEETGYLVVVLFRPPGIEVGMDPYELRRRIHEGEDVHALVEELLRRIELLAKEAGRP